MPQNNFGQTSFFQSVVSRYRSEFDERAPRTEEGKVYKRSPLWDTAISPRVNDANAERDCFVVDRDKPAFAATSDVERKKPKMDSLRKLIDWFSLKNQRSTYR